MKKTLIFIIAVLITATSTLAQVAINTDESDADASAILDVKSTSQGFLLPRMTTAQRDAIVAPADGLMIWNTTTNKLNVVSGGSYWSELPVGSAQITAVTNATTGEIWMDRNLGAQRVATASNDSLAYGHLYQWGRASDGHQYRNSDTTLTPATTATPNLGNIWDGKFIVINNNPNDWLVPQNDNLWQGEAGTNNPCPAGFRIPTDAELDDERLSWATNNSAGAYGSNLKLSVGGSHNYWDGALNNIGSNGNYWSSTVYGSNAMYFSFNSSNAGVNFSHARASGFTVRCIKD